MRKRIAPISRWILLWLATFLGGVNVIGQHSADSISTGGSLNGRFWEAMPANPQMAFLLGFQEGVEAGAVGGNYKQTVNAYYPDGFSNGDYLKEYGKELYTLYADRENIRIPIFMAIRFCALKLGGTLTNAELEEKLIEMRKASSAVEEKKP
jgi:hypothetical protein